MHGGQRRNAKIQFMTLHPHHDAAILRQASLRNIQIREELDARHHGSREIGVRDLTGLLQYAIDPVAQSQTVIEMLEMDIGSFDVQRPLDNLVYPLNNRCLTGEDLSDAQQIHRRCIKRAEGINLALFLVLSVSARTPPQYLTPRPTAAPSAFPVARCRAFLTKASCGFSAARTKCVIGG